MRLSTHAPLRGRVLGGECTRSPLTALSPTSRHRVTALCPAQLPARASRRSPALGAVAGSCTASRPYARRSCTNTMVVTSSYAGAAADPGIAPQPRADRGGRLTCRVAALCSARPLARASRRSLALGAAAYLYGDCNPLTDLLSLKAVRKIHRLWAQLGCLPRTTLLRNRISILAPVETGAPASSGLASQPPASHGKRHVPRVAAPSSALPRARPSLRPRARLRNAAGPHFAPLRGTPAPTRWSTRLGRPALPRQRAGHVDGRGTRRRRTRPASGALAAYMPAQPCARRRHFRESSLPGGRFFKQRSALLFPMDQGSRIKDQGSRIKDQGSRIKDQGSSKAQD